jgi:hypothetical protein
VHARAKRLVSSHWSRLVLRLLLSVVGGSTALRWIATVGVVLAVIAHGTVVGVAASIALSWTAIVLILIISTASSEAAKQMKVRFFFLEFFGILVPRIPQILTFLVG